MDTLRHDVRFALRSFAKSPGFTGVVLLTLALGIGANTAIFGLMDQVMLRRLPVRDPDRLVVLDGPGAISGHVSSSSDTLTPLSNPMFEGLREVKAFSGVLAHVVFSAHLSVDGETQNGNGDLVSGSYFPVLGLQPALGRLLSPDDDRAAGAAPVAVLGYRMFETRFGADPHVLGRTVRVNGQPLTVVGVAPRGFEGVDLGTSVDVYVPLAMQRTALPTWTPSLADWRTYFLTAMARLQDGVSREQAASDANVVYARLLQEDAQHLTARSEKARAAFLSKKLELLPGGRGTSWLRDEARSPLLVLMGMVGLVLLIACANVANLLLARGSSRQKELAVRLALGAGRGRLVRQLLVESLILSVAGGALGLLLSAWLGRVLIAALPLENAARTLSADPDLRVGAFAFALSLATGLVFGVVPAFQATRVAIAPTLKNEAGAVVGGGAHFRFRRGLVVAQIALSLLLLVGAGLFTRSLLNLRALDPGFHPEQVVSFSIDPSLSGYDMPQRLALFDRLREELGAEPGVRSASMAEVSLMTNSDTHHSISVPGYAEKDGENMSPDFNAVGPGFFATLGIPLVSGRDFTAGDGRGAPKVAVVNEAFARAFFGAQDPLGRTFRYRSHPEEDVRVVGVVKDGKAGSLREATKRFAYVPHSQQNEVGGMTFYVRAAGDPGSLLARVRAVAGRVDPALPVTELKTMRAQIRESLFVERMVASLSAAFGLLATLLAAVGLYGVMAFAVSLRTREIGIRMALGAQGKDVLRMVLRDVALLVALGVVVGLPGGYGLGRVVESQLFGLSARDPLTFATATATLVLAALLAGYLPARRATRVDPMVALRS